MQTLNEYARIKLPVDPLNTGSINYRYIALYGGYTFPGGCTISEPFYILRVTYESASNSPTPSGTAAATCGGETGWVSTATVRYVGSSRARQ
jgi:hypothetical protein